MGTSYPGWSAIIPARNSGVGVGGGDGKDSLCGIVLCSALVYSLPIADVLGKHIPGIMYM